MKIHLKKSPILILFFLALKSYAQIDSLKIGDKYWEDQLYLSLSYDILDKQPSGASKSGFSYSFSLGYIKDIPLQKNGKFAVGIGTGYSFNSFNHGLQIIDNNTIQLANNITSNKMSLHNIEFPLQIRWRTSDAVTYSFWRLYGGVRFSYNLSNNFSYLDENNASFEFSNIDIYNRFQSGLELSAGYGAFNLYVYYGLTSIFKDVSINSETVNSKIMKFGLIFYLL
ncbi:porin family protein [Tenacibaculum sp. M341]|uniref:porin family protein n=1 Tax=Tenacibaculum sp. M341 TaxID=2530339 RepID=UPI00104E395A|nr:porin family protein [Tenacibaculum sp. M341]TCI94267.1 PorT family protein [Tenacibaculum sp. M341]